MLFHSIAPLAFLSLLAACAAASEQPPAAAAIAERPLRLATWNLEFLAETNGIGCQPRDDADYAAMKRIVEGLDADVIAFQEAESVAAAERIFDPAALHDRDGGTARRTERDLRRRA